MVKSEELNDKFSRTFIKYLYEFLNYLYEFFVKTRAVIGESLRDYVMNRIA